MSTVSQVVSSEYYSRTSLSRHISESVKAEIYALYGGHRQCAITKSGMGPTWCHILPYTEELMHESLSQAKNLGLVHPDIHIYSESNLVPLSADICLAFDDKKVIIYPIEVLLRERINLEEQHLVYREQCIANGKPDPGRLSYEQSYGRFSRRNTFQAFCGYQCASHYMTVEPPLPPSPTVYPLMKATELPTIYSLKPRQSNLPFLPPFELEISIELLLLARASDISVALPSTAEIRRLELLGTHLRRLWFATPGDFRQLRQGVPDLLQPLPDPPQVIPVTQGISSQSAANISLEQRQAEEDSSPSPGTESPSAEETKHHYFITNQSKCTSWLLSLPSSGEMGGGSEESLKKDKLHLLEAADPEEGSLFSDGSESDDEQHPANGAERSIYRTLTSNEHALITYGIRLGGPVWNY